MANILVVDDNRAMCEVLEEALHEKGYRVDATTSSEEGAEFLRRHSYNILITDLKMPGIDGLEMMKIAREENASIEALVITAFGTVETAVQAMKDGASDFILKPFPVTEIELKVAKLLERQRLRSENLLLREELKNHYDFGNLIGRSESMKKVYDTIQRVAVTNSPILIRGETGTGKELVARALHGFSRRASRPFIKVNCSALSPGLLESEMFGHEKGSFTGATARKEGRFMLADAGTIFLDEIGEMPGPMQAKLLRVLQDGEFERVGGVETIRADVRIIAATNRDLEQAMQNGTFREDLFFRLNVIPIEIPPLRERLEDIPDLLAYCLHKYNITCAKQIEGFEPGIEQNLLKYRWPGNIRELENIVERAVVLCDGNTVPLRLLPKEILAKNAKNLAENGVDVDYSQGLNPLVECYESGIIDTALRKAGGSQVKAAKLLKVNRSTLQYKIQKYGLGKK